MTPVPIIPPLRIDDFVSEEGFQRCVVELAVLAGWKWFHVHDSRRSNPGWPDLALANEKRQRFMLRELKTQKGRLSREQKEWLATLKLCGIDADVWHPSDWPIIVKELTGSDEY